MIPSPGGSERLQSDSDVSNPGALVWSAMIGQAPWRERGEHLRGIFGQRAVEVAVGGSIGLP